MSLMIVYMFDFYFLICFRVALRHRKKIRRLVFQHWVLQLSCSVIPCIYLLYCSSQILAISYSDNL